MIARISGKLVYSSPPELLVDVNGIGYEIYAPMTTIFQLPTLDQPVVLFTHLAVSETSQTLYGFIHEADRKLFRLLIKVSGVGPKMAISIMSMESDNIVQHIRDDNVAALVKVPGVGKKTAERLIIEMRDKLKDWSVSGASVSDRLVKFEGRIEEATVIGDAESALIALGYKPSDAAKVISKVYSEEITRSEDLIKKALRSMLPAK